MVGAIYADLCRSLSSARCVTLCGALRSVGDVLRVRSSPCLGIFVSRWNESRAGGDTLLMSGGVQADNATIRLIAPVLGLQT